MKAIFLSRSLSFLTTSHTATIAICTVAVSRFETGSSIQNARYGITYDQRRVSTVNGSSKTIYSGLFEERPNGDRLNYVSTPNGIGAMVLTNKHDPGKRDIYYLYQDHLGSLIAAHKAGGSLVEFSYDPWGRRRKHNDWNDYDVQSNSLFTRGFTFHEHIDEYGLINMNGRVYDSRLGRFLSPDPYVQAPDFTQNFNRYAYAWNNPLIYTDPDGEFVHLIIGAIIGGYSGYKIGKARGATGWGMFGYIAGGAAIGTVTGHIGASLYASSMTAATAAGYGGFSAGFNAGMISGLAAGGFSGGGMAALNGGNILAGATMGAWFGGVTGGLLGGINQVVAEGLEKAFHNRNIREWSKSLTADAWTFNKSTGTFGEYTPNPGLGGRNYHIYFPGQYASDASFMVGGNSFVVKGSNTINAFRFWQSVASTISAFHHPGSGLSGYFLEPKGPSTVISGQNQRIPAGSYSLTPNINTYPGNYMLYNSNVASSRGITIHSGNIPGHTRGCLLPGGSWRPDFVGGSDNMRLQINLQINQAGHRNMRFNIFDAF